MLEARAADRAAGRRGLGHRLAGARGLTGYLGLGSNVGDRRAHLQAAVDALPRHGVHVLASSATYDTDPVGEVLDQPPFLNACVRIATELGPEELLDACKAVEAERGRGAAEAPGYVRHGPRPLDVDVLLLDDVEHRSERLTLPHAQVLTRRFVLVPLLELDFGLATPDGARLADALARLPLDEGVRRAGPALRVATSRTGEVAAQVPYPPAPWRIAGPAAICPVLVPLEVARELVPADVAVVAVAPGRTAGGVLVARYDEPSTLRYGELLVLPALTRVRGRLGWWVSHAYVDSQASLAGGRRMWGVPKDPATFSWRDGGVAITGEDGAALLDASWHAPPRRARVPALVATNGTTGGADRRRFVGTGSLTMAPARMRLDVAGDSPFAALPLHGRRLALAGCADLRLRAPQVLA